MKTKEEKYFFRHWFLRYSSSGLTAILLFLLAIKMNSLERFNSSWVICVLSSSILMGIWFFFRFFSVLTMNNLVNKVYIGEITYEDLFSYEISKHRMLKVLLLTVISMVFIIVLNYVFILQHERITLLFLTIESLGIILLSYQRASKKLHLALTVEAIEESRFLTKHLIVDGTE